ncbi:hypothetical protein chiPu_0009023 [Chiloscyllium punctatum]|uniref:Prohormone convertase enzyme domain-containing protein n=1 Tax=Chiloscyllium punctatum TaxID=137246 RepID=A0A401SJJ4_CHIPU|nr:hypothetical protein [Chiloscyllium punctatum]
MENKGEIIDWKLILHGTSTKPEHMQKPRVYTPYNAVQNDRRGVETMDELIEDDIFRDIDPRNPYRKGNTSKENVNIEDTKEEAALHATSAQKPYDQQNQDNRALQFFHHSRSHDDMKLPSQNFYQATGKLNKQAFLKDLEDSELNEYRDHLYDTKSITHRDDRLLQALLEILAESQ